MKTEAMSSPLAIFTCRPTSHPFQERHIAVNERIKIGRSVARARPAANNAIFDCKVLSRNHALLWFESNKFFLQDTKSSNGTFVNSQRLSKGSEESPPREIFSGDIIQFGVDVMENSRRVTHGCIMAAVTLFTADGTEIKPAFDSISSGLSSQSGTAINSQELYLLSQYLQEALQREQMMESKLATLQRVMDSTQKASESSWQALIDEDRLLSRLEALQNQLSIYSKTHSDGGLQEQLVLLHTEKASYEATAKESLRKVLEEKLEAVQKLADLERLLSNTEGECNNVRRLYDLARSELSALADTHDRKIVEFHELQEQLREVEKSAEDERQNQEENRRVLKEQLEDVLMEKSMLSARVEELLSENDLAQEELLSARACADDNKKNANFNGNGDDSMLLEVAVSELDNIDATNCERLLNANVLVTPLEQRSPPVRDRLDDMQTLQQKYLDALTQIAACEDQLRVSDQRLAEMSERETQLQSQLDQAQIEVVQYVTKMAALEDRSKNSDLLANQALESSCAGLRLQLGEAQAQVDHMAGHVKKLEGDLMEISSERDVCHQQVKLLQQELDSSRRQHQSQAECVSTAVLSTKEAEEKAVSLQDKLHEEQEQHRKLLQETHMLRDNLQQAERLACEHSSSASNFQVKVTELEGRLEEAQLAKQEELSRSHSLLADFDALRKDNADQLTRLKTLQTELQWCKDAREKLENDNAQLTVSHDELHMVKLSLETTEQRLQSDLATTVRNTTDALDQLRKANEEIALFKAQCSTHSKEVTGLNASLDGMSRDLATLSSRSRAISFCSIVPLFVLLFAIVMALHPSLSWLTATVDP